MNWINKNTRTLKTLGLTALLITPMLIGGGIFWAHKTQEKLTSITKTHWNSHQTTTQLINRDIEDLEGQIQRATGKVPVGEFSFYNTKSGLKATHTSLVNQSINVSSENGSAFEKVLNSQADSQYVVLNSKLEPISFTNGSRPIAMQAASRNKFIEGSTVEPLLMTNFSNTTLSDSKTWLQFFKAPEYSFVSSRVASSNMHLLSFVPLSSLWSSSLESLVFILSALFGSFALIFAFLRRQQSKQMLSQKWIQNVFEGLKVGKLDAASLDNTTCGDSHIAKTVKESLLNGSTLQTLFAAHWIDESRRLATWSHFSTTLKAWGEGSATEKTYAPEQWIIGSVVFSRTSLAENFSRALTKSGELESLFVFHTDETTMHFYFECPSLKDGIERIQATAKGFSKGLEINSFDFALSAYFTNRNCENDSFKLLDKSLLRTQHLNKLTEETLDTRNVEVRSSISDTTLFFNSTTTHVLSPIQKVIVAQSAPATEEVPAKPAKRMPVPKKRLQEKKAKLKLPPPPTLQNRIRAKSLSQTKTGKAFVKVSDALGKTNWIEVKSNDATKI